MAFQKLFYYHKKIDKKCSQKIVNLSIISIERQFLVDHPLVLIYILKLVLMVLNI